MNLAVDLLSVLVGLACALLLLRAHRRAPSRLLSAAALCFLGLALNDASRILDVFVLSQVDLRAVRSLPALAGLLILVRALVAEAR